MLPLGGYLESALLALLRRLPLSDYQKTRLWATSLPRPSGPMKGFPYYRSIEMGALALTAPEHAREFVLDPQGSYSIAEFGVANGEGFRLMLHCRDTIARKYGLTNRIHALGFDTFEGMPEPREGDDGLIWRKGDLPSDVEALQAHLETQFADFELVKGYFSETLPGRRGFFEAHPPIFVSLDCDYYSSTADVLDFLLPELAPNGCLFYFDDIGVNFFSSRTGQMRAVAEVNAGKYGDHIQLIEYPLWVETRELRHYAQLYRYFNLKKAEEQQRNIRPSRDLKRAPRTATLSPL